MEDEVELRLDFEARSTILTGAGVGCHSKESWGNQGVRPNVVVACNPPIVIGGVWRVGIGSFRLFKDSLSNGRRVGPHLESPWAWKGGLSAYFHDPLHYNRLLTCVKLKRKIFLTAVRQCSSQAKHAKSTKRGIDLS